MISFDAIGQIYIAQGATDLRKGIDQLSSMINGVFDLRLVKRNRVSFDMVVHTMNLTGKKLPMELKETCLDGLAVVVPVQEEEKS